MNEEVFAGLRFAAARAYQVLGFEMRLVGAEVTDAGEELCE